MFERFDEAEARFAKLFAAFVLLLVLGLITFDIVSVALGWGISGGAPAANLTPVSICQSMPDGTQICDIPPPNIPR